MKKQAKAPPVNLMDAQEDEMVGWLHPELFNHSEKHYRKAKHKEQLWAYKEVELESGAYLHRWYQSMLKRYGKQNKPKSGDWAKELSTHEKFHFIGQNIYELGKLPFFLFHAWLLQFYIGCFLLLVVAFHEIKWQFLVCFQLGRKLVKAP